MNFSVSNFLLITSLILPKRLRISLLRSWKGRDERDALSRAQLVVLSYPKSGRTWLAIMLSRMYAVTYGLDINMLVKNDNFHRLETRIPVIFFTHGWYLEELTGGLDLKPFFAGKKILFLARHPADVAVSFYFHITGGRVNPLKRDMKLGSGDFRDISIPDLALSPKWGVPAIIKYLNFWHGVFADNPNVLMMHYEDLKTSPEMQLLKISAFIGETFSNETIRQAMEVSSFERLQEQERSGVFKSSALRPRDPSDPDTFKVRRGKMFGYVDYFDAAKIAMIDEMIVKDLKPEFGYGTPADAAQPLDTSKPKAL